MKSVRKIINKLFKKLFKGTAVLSFLRIFICVLVTFLLGLIQGAEPPHIQYIYPAGARQGETVRLVFGGQNILGGQELIFSEEGFSYEITGFSKIYDDRGVRQLLRGIDLTRIKLENLKSENTGKTAAIKQIKQLEKRLTHNLALLESLHLPENTLDLFSLMTAGQPLSQSDLKNKRKELYSIIKRFKDPKRQPNSQLEDQLFVTVNVSSLKRPGLYSVRLKTGKGLSNPLLFEVGTLPDVIESSNTVTASGNLPAVFNGQIMPGESDLFAFQLQSGRQYVFRCKARKLIPYLPDAVPGWFQPVMILYSPDGQEAAYNDDFRTDPDPVIIFSPETSGKYTLEIRDSIYRGREDFVYRIEAGELPQVTAFFPPGGRAGSKINLTLKGVNLPVTTLPITLTPGKLPGSEGLISCKESPYLPVLTLTASGDGFNYTSQPLQLMSGELPETTDLKNESGSLTVSLPVIINGRITRPGQIRVYRFKLSAGAQLVAEVFARRLDSPLDSCLEIYSPSGKKIAVSDDHVDRSRGLVTHHADSYLLIKAPENGIYTLKLYDIQRKAGPAHNYRLRLSPPQPDFEVCITPDTAHIPKGGTTTLTAHLFRKDGFKGPVALSLYNMKQLYVAGDAVIPKGGDEVTFTVSSSYQTSERIIPAEFLAHAVIDGKEIYKKAWPAEDRMQAFLWRFLVRSETLYFTRANWHIGTVLIDRKPDEIILLHTKTPTKLPLYIKPGQKTLNQKLGDIAINVLTPPKGISVKETVLMEEEPYIVLTVDQDVLKTEYQGNLILQGMFTPRGKDGREKQAIEAFLTRSVPFRLK